ncbi:ead/Ea22-like family protein [Salmonella enterica]|nr:ead/Ea22-like family protein [Salmonella enterica]ELV8423779.1 ead/Ea22-like family protein [Salmonella enterica]EMA0288301.1 ead/Ea22-like family protein [Salmonella enterica]
MITGTSNYDEVPTIPCKICGGYFKADDPENHKCEDQPMSNIDKQALLGADKHANQHRLSRLIIEANSAELRAIAEAVEQYTDQLIAALADSEKRIAELEARKVNLSKLSVGEVMHMSGFSRDYAEGWCAGNDNAIHEIRTAGIKVKES